MSAPKPAAAVGLWSVEVPSDWRRRGPTVLGDSGAAGQRGAAAHLANDEDTQQPVKDLKISDGKINLLSKIASSLLSKPHASAASF